jgi:hypothetical protein
LTETARRSHRAWRRVDAPNVAKAGGSQQRHERARSTTDVENPQIARRELLPEHLGDHAQARDVERRCQLGVLSCAPLMILPILHRVTRRGIGRREISCSTGNIRVGHAANGTRDHVERLGQIELRR